MLRTWLTELQGQPTDAVFPYGKEPPSAAIRCQNDQETHGNGSRKMPGPIRKKPSHPHALWHTTAMLLLQGGEELSVIALWGWA